MSLHNDLLQIAHANKLAPAQRAALLQLAHSEISQPSLEARILRGLAVLAAALCGFGFGTLA